MDAFSYLSVLLSIILGLAITQILQGYRGLLLHRRRVRLYAPPLIWSVVMLVFATQIWWSSFGLAEPREWTFGGFGIILLQTVLTYMMAALVLPDAVSDADIDLRQHYHAESRPFFAIALAMLMTSIGKEWLLEGQLPEPTNLLFHGIFAVVSIAGLIFRGPRAHLMIALFMSFFIIAYVTILFARL